MRRSLLLLLAVAALGLGVGCNATATDPFYLDQEIKAKYPGATFSRLPGEKYKVILRMPTGEVWLVQQDSLSGPQVTNQVLLFK